jgi:guanine deaminase
MNDVDEVCMNEAIEQALAGMRNNEGGPFGAVIAKNGTIIGKGRNKVISSNDPTAHAEIIAIRDACMNLKTFQLADCVIYTTCEPCPMCLSAIYWARLKLVYFGCTRHDAAQIGFDDNFIYEELKLEASERAIPMTQLWHNEALKVFDEWENKIDKIQY